MQEYSRLGVAPLSALVLVLLSATAFALDVDPKVVAIGWIAFAAMAGGALLGSFSTGGHARNLAWGYGLSSGAMLTSAAVFLVPPALSHHTTGGLGIASGVVAGFVAHTAGHRTSHSRVDFDYTVASLTAHTLAAGVIIGVVYASMPSLGLLLGVGIVSHKAPAGYAAARRLTDEGKSPTVLLIPSSGVGITAITSNALGTPTTPVVDALVFGFAAGIFLHVSMDFLPRCELGSDVYEVAERDRFGTDPSDAHRALDRLRVHAVVSTVVGAVAVAAAWVVA